MEGKKCILLAGGSLSEEFLRQCFKENPDWKSARIICVDRGLNYIGGTGLIPDMIVGDFDSADSSVVKWWRKKEKEGKTRFLKLNPIKDSTDTHIALLEAVKTDPKEIFILGAAGGRLDHFLGNLNLLMIPLKMGIRAWIMDEKNKICLAEHSFEIEKKDCFGKYISFLPFTEKVANVTMKGFRYETDGITMALGDSLGISNEIVSKKAAVSFEDGVLIVVQSKD